MLTLDRKRGLLLDGSGRRFLPRERGWHPSDSQGGGEPVNNIQAVTWLQRESSHPVRAPISVIGPRDADAAQCACAEAIGRGLARMGLAVTCGGRSGIMEAVCRGVSAEGGIAIGILPDPNPDLANTYVSVAIATGIGEARNAIIARAGFCLVAIGNSYGTLSEVALGLQFGKRVFGIMGAADLEEVVQFEDPSSLLESAAEYVLGLA